MGWERYLKRNEICVAGRKSKYINNCRQRKRQTGRERDRQTGRER